MVSVDPAAPDPAVIADAAAIIKRGGLVAFPTETVYGLGANALDEAAVRRIFEAKRRSLDDPLIVHLASSDDLDSIVAAVIPTAARTRRALLARTADAGTAEATDRTGRRDGRAADRRRPGAESPLWPRRCSGQPACRSPRPAPTCSHARAPRRRSTSSRTSTAESTWSSTAARRRTASNRPWWRSRRPRYACCARRGYARGHRRGAGPRSTSPVPLVLGPSAAPPRRACWRSTTRRARRCFW